MRKMSNELSKEEIGYLAGFLDADGSIYIQKSGRKFSLKINFTNTDYSIVKNIEKLLEKGGVSASTYTFGGSEKHKKAYRTGVYAQKDGIFFLRLVKDLLVGKKPQAEFALKFLRLKSHIGRTPPNSFQEEKLERYYEQMKELNQRGK